MEEAISSDLASLFHECTGEGCSFCNWRKENPIELGWEPLMEKELYGVKLTSSQVADPHKELSTQQTSDFLANFDDDDDNFPAYDAEFEQILTQVEQQSTTTQVAVRRFASPKGKSAIKAAKHSSIPVKTRDQTNWSVKVWEEWAQNRNTNLLPGEKPFSTNFCDLSIPEMDFWLSHFVLEVRKQKDGEPYPPNMLYQLVCGLQCLLRESGRAEIKLLDNPLLHGFKATLDGEMMRLYSKATI